MWCAKGYLKPLDTGGVGDTYKETRGIQEMDTRDTLAWTYIKWDTLKKRQTHAYS